MSLPPADSIGQTDPEWYIAQSKNGYDVCAKHPGGARLLAEGISLEDATTIIRDHQVAEVARRLRGGIGHGYISERHVFQFISEYDATLKTDAVPS